MRYLPLVCLLALSQPATAETLSAEIARAGIAPTEARLASLAAPSDGDVFALGGLRFLAALESAMQQRWRFGLTDRTGMLPFMRAPIAENPTPQSFDPALVANIFRDTNTRMDSARAALVTLSPDDGFSVQIDFADIWFDINGNQMRDQGEDMMAIFGPMLMGWEWETRDPGTPAPVVLFDTSDAPWLAAYTHLISALSEIVLAYDPTEPTGRILAARTQMSAFGPMTSDFIFGGDANSDGLDSLDILAIVLETLNQTPDSARMASAQQHLLAMIAENRRFWTLVATETDNSAEWLPNDQQTSALGLTLPPNTGAAWQAMLADLESILTGKLLVSYWRFEQGVGVNIAKLFTDPRPIDVAGWIQGWAALPYLETGPLVGSESSAALDAMFQGNPMLLALYLN